MSAVHGGAVAALCGTLLLAGCKPAGPPPDLIAPQRAALNKAKALEGQMKDDVEQRMKSVDQTQ